MNIKVLKATERREHTSCTGGEYATCNLEITVDDALPIELQRELVIHSVIENYDRSMPHEKVEELTGFICEALDQLEDEE